MLKSFDANTIVVGTRQTVKMIKKDKVNRVYIAKDCDEPIQQRIANLCEEHGIEIEQVDTMEELGEAAGIERKTAAVAKLK